MNTYNYVMCTSLLIAHMCTYVCSYLHTYIHIYMYMYIPMYTCTLGSVCRFLEIDTLLDNLPIYWTTYHHCVVSFTGVQLVMLMTHCIWFSVQYTYSQHFCHIRTSTCVVLSVCVWASWDHLFPEGFLPVLLHGVSKWCVCCMMQDDGTVHTQVLIADWIRQTDSCLLNRWRNVTFLPEAL